MKKIFSNLVTLFFVSTMMVVPFVARASSGIVLIKEINAVGASSPGSLINVGGTLFFTADNSTNGRELWKSDGTASGTVMVKDIKLGASSSNLTSLVDVGGTLFFTADNGTNGHELWKSDGTASGTVMVRDVQVGAGGSGPDNLASINGVLYFSANNGTNDVAAWKSDGTDAGTEMFANCVVDGWSCGSIPSGFTQLNGSIAFSVDSALYSYNGSSNTLIKDICTGCFDARIHNITRAGNYIVFGAYDNDFGDEPWRSDGTANGTYMLNDIVNSNNSSFPANFVTSGDYAYFFVDLGPGQTQEWQTNGITATPLSLLGSVVDGIFEFNGNTNYFTHFTSFGGQTDTTTFYRNFSSVYDYDYNLNLSSVHVMGDNFYFYGYDKSSNPGYVGGELWRSNGVATGTQFVSDINPGSGNANIQYITNIGDVLYFSATDGVHGNELWSYTVNRAPSAESISSSVSSGVVTASTVVTDVDNDPIDLYIDYSIDNGSTWASSTIKTVTTSSGSISTTTGRILGITSTSVGNNLSFTWDTKEAGIISSSQAKLKITSYDGYVFGTPIVSSVFTVDNTPLISLSKLTLSPTRAVVNAAPDYLTIKLNAKPTNDVTITPIQSIDNLLSLSPTFFTFTSDNWNTAQNLVVYASSSQATIGSLTFVSSSTDSNFHNLTPVAPTTVAVTITAVSNGNSSSGSSSGSSGSSGSSSSSSSAGTVVVSPTIISNNTPTQVVSNNQPTTITSPSTQTVQTTSSFISNNTSASLVIPAGTITTPATLQIKASESISAPLPIASTQTFNSSPIGDVVFDISLKDNATQSNITSFSSSNLQLTINIPTISSTEDMSLLGLYYLNETTNQWIRVDNASFNLSTKQVTASLNHLTKFAVFKSTDKILNTEETSPSDFVETPSDKEVVGMTTPVSLPLLTTKQLNTLKGKFISDKNNNIFYIDMKTKKIEQVTTNNAIKYIAKIATGIKNKDLIKISNITDKKVSSFSKKFLTKVLMAVEDKGQLWYVNKDGKKAKVYDAIGLVKVMAVRVK